MLEATQKMSSSGKENSVKEDALITPAPVYKQLSSLFFFFSHILFNYFCKDFYKLMLKNMLFKIYYIILLMDFEDNRLD
jgi:hypothetical protein